MPNPDLSDEATGLPPLAEVIADDAIVLCAWDASEGIAAGYAEGSVAVRYLHVRGIINAPDGTLEWGQVHIAVPVEVCLDVAAALAKGTTERLDEADGSCDT